MKNEKKWQDSVLRFTQVSPTTNMLFHLLMIVLSLVCLVPLALVLSISLSSESALQEFGYRLFPKAFSLDGYAYLFKQSDTILRAMGMSIMVTVVGTALSVILNALMGYVLSRREYKLQKIFVWFVFIPMIFNGGLVSSYFIVSQFLGLKDTVWVLIVPLAVSSFNVILCKTFFRTTIPDSLIESAKIDGASQMSVFFTIVLPLSLPVLATIGLFSSFGYWNDWFTAMLYIDNPNLYTLQAYLNRLLGDINFLAQNAALLGVSQAQLLASMPKEAARMAIVVVAVLPIACAYPFFQRYFVSGLTVGAVKG
ncbi:MAG: carbohydrate ABC transporter permease [Spirochaetaceae bacterium]|jgi:putative aldouronate transport system permease protein|nr:carbohydrate ABC transporter permease [Spirochaetaceae bacterium]